MALASSGPLSLVGGVNTPQQCGSISYAVCGNFMPCSLSAVSIAAGKTAPHSMTEFYGFAFKPLSFYTISQSGQGSGTACVVICPLYSTSEMDIGSCMSVCLTGTLSTTQQPAGSSAYYKIMCNGTQIYCCGIGAGACTTAILKQFPFVRGNQVCLVLYAATTNTACQLNSNASANFGGIVNISGTYCIGSPSSGCAYTG